MLDYFREVEILRKVRITYEIAENDLSRRSDPKIVALLETVCGDKGVPCHKMFSGAYHDSLIIGEIVPMAMIFIPSHKGISRDPAEFTDYEHIAVGIDVLAQALLSLATEL